MTLILILSSNYSIIAQPTKQEDKFIAFAANGEFDKIENYIKKGINVNARNKSKWTALAYACKYNHLEIVKLLVDSGANVNTTVNVGSTPLLIAFTIIPIEARTFVSHASFEFNSPQGSFIKVLMAGNEF